MKKQLMRFVSATPYSKFLTASALVLVLSGSAVNAQVSQVSASMEHEGTGIRNAVINHIGTAEGKLLFEVKVDNTLGEKFRVLITDNDGNVLFQDTYSDRNFAKKFLVQKPENDKLSFTIKSASATRTESFGINSTTHVVEEVVVKRI